MTFNFPNHLAKIFDIFSQEYQLMTSNLVIILHKSLFISVWAMPLAFWRSLTLIWLKEEANGQKKIVAPFCTRRKGNRVRKDKGNRRAVLNKTHLQCGESSILPLNPHTPNMQEQQPRSIHTHTRCPSASPSGPLRLLNPPFTPADFAPTLPREEPETRGQHSGSDRNKNVCRYEEAL